MQVSGEPLLAPEHVFFELTKTEKIKRIGDKSCDVFIDDLPEILQAPEFPGAARRILFDPDAHHRDVTGLTSVASWDEARAQLETACATPH